VRRAKEYRTNASGFEIRKRTEPLGSELQQAPWVRQKEHWHARIAQLLGRRFVV
jgi:hypothetical protein